MGNAGRKLRGGRGADSVEERAKKKSSSGLSRKERRERGIPLPPDILTDEEIEDIQVRTCATKYEYDSGVLQTTWPHVRPEVNELLTHAFLDLFVANPDVKEKFVNFRNVTVEDLQRTKDPGEISAAKI